jgi:hypothetical protein
MLWRGMVTDNVSPLNNNSRNNRRSLLFHDNYHEPQYFMFSELSNQAEAQPAR